MVCQPRQALLSIALDPQSDRTGGLLGCTRYLRLGDSLFQSWADDGKTFEGLCSLRLRKYREWDKRFGHDSFLLTRKEPTTPFSRSIPDRQDNCQEISSLISKFTPKGTGKSFVYDNLSRYARVVSGGKVTPAVLFHHQVTNTSGLITRYDVVVFDEVQSIAGDSTGELIAGLKVYLESG